MILKFFTNIFYSLFNELNNRQLLFVALFFFTKKWLF